MFDNENNEIFQGFTNEIENHINYIKWFEETVRFLAEDKEDVLLTSDYKLIDDFRFIFEEQNIFEEKCKELHDELVSESYTERYNDDDDEEIKINNLNKSMFIDGISYLIKED